MAGAYARFPAAELDAGTLSDLRNLLSRLGLAKED
jgi:hypothetical protein